MKIWVDADACPKMVKEMIFKASIRLNIPTCLVANAHLSIPFAPTISFVQVDKGAVIADQHIVEQVNAGDLVITADIPLAALVVEKEAVAIDPRGEVYTEENIRERLSVRNFMQELRESGTDTGGPLPLGPKDKERFANALKRLLKKLNKD